MRLFGAHGFDGASTRDIAREAGVNAPALQYYFDNKEGVYLACIDYFVERVQAALWPSVLSTQHVPVRHSNLGEEAGAIGGIVALMAQQRATEPQKEASMSPNRLEVTGAPRVG